MSKHTDRGWDIRREGRAWAADEAKRRLALVPAKIEIEDGKLLGIATASISPRSCWKTLAPTLPIEALALGWFDYWVKAATTAFVER